MPLESGRVKLSLTTARENYQKGIQDLQLPLPGNKYAGEFQDLARVIRGEKLFAWDATHDIAVHETLSRAANVWKETDQRLP